jgi:hypothetical protein
MKKFILALVMTVLLGILITSTVVANNVECPPKPTKTIIPTKTVTVTKTPTPTETVIPTNTPVITETPVVTETPIITLPPVITVVPPVGCKPVDTGRQVNELVMFNTDPMHYGFWTETSKTGICKIEGPDGSYISSARISTACACQMPGFVWRTDKIIIWHIMKDCSGKFFLVDVNGVRGQPYGGWVFGSYCGIAGCR